MAFANSAWASSVIIFIYACWIFTMDAYYYTTDSTLDAANLSSANWTKNFYVLIDCSFNCGSSYFI